MEREIEEPDFGALRSLLHGEVSPARWRRLLWLVSGRGWDARSEEWLPYVQDMLDERWPDTVRVWLKALRWSGKPKAANQLVRSYQMTRTIHSADLLAFELDQWSRHAPPLTILGLKRVPLDAASAAQLVAQIPSTLHTLVLRLGYERTHHLTSALLAARPPALARLDFSPHTRAIEGDEVWRWIEAPR